MPVPCARVRVRAFLFEIERGSCTFSWIKGSIDKIHRKTCNDIYVCSKVLNEFLEKKEIRRNREKKNVYWYRSLWAIDFDMASQKRKLEAASRECKQRWKRRDRERERNTTTIPKITQYNLFCPDLMRDEWIRSSARPYTHMPNLAHSTSLMVFGHFKCELRWFYVVDFLLTKIDEANEVRCTISIQNTCMYFT